MVALLTCSDNTIPTFTAWLIVGIVDAIAVLIPGLATLNIVLDSWVNGAVCIIAICLQLVCATSATVVKRQVAVSISVVIYVDTAVTTRYRRLLINAVAVHIRIQTDFIDEDIHVVGRSRRR